MQYPQFRCARRITAEKELVFDGDNDYIALVNNASIHDRYFIHISLVQKHLLRPLTCL